MSLVTPPSRFETGVATGAATSSEVLVQMGGSVDQLARMSADLRERIAAFTY